MFYVYNSPTPFRIVTHEEQRELIRLAKEGEAIATKQLIESVMRALLVRARKVAERFDLPYEQFTDLVHSGVEGCHAALERFDLNKTNKGFWVYACWWAENKMMKFIFGRFRNPATSEVTVETELLESFDHVDDEPIKTRLDQPRVRERIQKEIANLTCKRSQLLVEYMYLSGRYRNGRVTARVFGCSFQAVYQRLNKIFGKLRLSLSDLNPQQGVNRG